MDPDRPDNPINNTRYIARWDGSTWNALGSGLNNSVSAIAVEGPDLYVGGWFTNTAGTPFTDHIARWGISYRGYLPVTLKP
jgi:hypothetical protein